MKSAVLAGLRTRETDQSWAQKLDEAALLCEACGIEVKARLTQKAQKGHPRTLIGSGKAAELKQSCEAQSAEGAVFVMDRSALILEIFARRARTRQAHLQVEAARLAYQLPRLIEGQIHADQQQGGGVRNRGAGETRLERSRRTIEKQIRDIRVELEQLKLQTAGQRRPGEGRPCG